MDKKCPDCQGDLTKIKLFGRGWENPITNMAVDADLGFYAHEEAERGDFSGMFKPAGQVESYLCHDCGRIFLFGVQQ